MNNLGKNKNLFLFYMALKKNSSFTKKSYPKKSSYKKVRKNTKPSKAFAKKVQNIIHKDVETKTVTFSSNVTAFNQQMNATGDCLRLMPQISNGTAENQKIGNMIKLQSLKLRGVLTFTLGQTSAANVRMGVRMMIIKAKRFKDWNSAATDFGTNFTRLLEGTTTGFQGLVSEFNAPVNNDYFSVVMDKRYYLSQSLQSTGANVADTVYTSKLLNIDIPYCRRTVTYDQDYSLTDPIDFPYFMLLGYTKLDGAAADLPATAYLTFQYVTTAKFEDA